MGLVSDDLRDGVISEDDILDEGRKMAWEYIMNADVRTGIEVVITALRSLLDNGIDLSFCHNNEDIEDAVLDVLEQSIEDLGKVEDKIPRGPNTDETDKYSYR